MPNPFTQVGWRGSVKNTNTSYSLHKKYSFGDATLTGNYKLTWVGKAINAYCEGSSLQGTTSRVFNQAITDNTVTINFQGNVIKILLPNSISNGRGYTNLQCGTQNVYGA